MKKEEIRKINKLRALFPSSIKVSISRAENGDFLAQIHTFPGIFTEGRSFSELMEMVNDAVRTYFEVPKKLIPYMPTYIPPLQVAQRLDVFPVIKISKNVTLPLSISEKVAVNIADSSHRELVMVARKSGIEFS